MHMPAAQIRRGPGGTRPHKLAAAAHSRQSGPAAHKRPRRVCTNLEGRRSAGGGRGGHGSAGFAKSTLQATREESQQERARPKQPWMRAGGRSSAAPKAFCSARRRRHVAAAWELSGAEPHRAHAPAECVPGLLPHTDELLHVCGMQEDCQSCQGWVTRLAPPSGAPPWVHCVWEELTSSASVGGLQTAAWTTHRRLDEEGSIGTSQPWTQNRGREGGVRRERRKASAASGCH